MGVLVNILVVFSVLTTLQSVCVDAFVSKTNISTSNASHDQTLINYKWKKTEIKKHPYLVLVHAENNYCSAVIVSKRWVVTTADCVTINPKKVSVVTKRKYGNVRKVSNVTLHPGFPGDLYDFEFACVQIEGEFRWSKNLRPAKLPRKMAPSNTSLNVLRWHGVTRGSSKTKHLGLKEGKMSLLTRKECKKYLSQIGVTYTKRIACARSDNRTALCNHDWADPFMKDGVLYGQFVGAAAADFCSSEAAKVILSDVSAAAKWIRRVTGAEFNRL